MEKRSKIILLSLVHQLLGRICLMLSLLIRERKRIVSTTRRAPRRESAPYSMTQRINAQLSHLHRIIDAVDVQCVANLRMNCSAFARLCYLLRNLGGLVDSRYVRLEEKVSMFLSILAHLKRTG